MSQVVRKSKPAYAVLIAQAHAELIRRHRDGYTSSSLYFHLAKHYSTVTRKGVAAALAKMADSGQAQRQAMGRWKVAPAARRALLKPKAAKGAKGAKPKSASAYVHFCSAKRADIVAANPGASFGDVAKALGAAWQQLTPAEKAAYAAPGKAKAVRGNGPKASRGQPPVPAPGNDPRAAPAPAAEPGDALPHKWQYEDHGWHDYDAAAWPTLEAHWAEYQADPHNFDVRSVHSGSWAYLVDFKALKQTNVAHEAHTMRNVRRVPC